MIKKRKIHNRGCPVQMWDSPQQKKARQMRDEQIMKNKEEKNLQKKSNLIMKILKFLKKQIIKMMIENNINRVMMEKNLWKQKINKQKKQLQEIHIQMMKNQLEKKIKNLIQK